MPRRPTNRGDFHFAIICALPLEYDAVYDSLDEVWADEGYGKAPGDPNRYATGRMGELPVVLLLLPGKGKSDAASAAASLRSSYENLCLALVVGVCGAIPYLSDGTEVILGDVIISKYIVRYDFGRQYSDQFRTKRAIEDTLGRPDKETRILGALLETSSGRDELEEEAHILLKQLQEKLSITKHHSKYDYMGASHDQLFKPDYRHKHYAIKICEICDACHSDLDPVCEGSFGLKCAELGCDHNYLTVRTRLREQRYSTQIDNCTDPGLAIHVGGIGSADTEMQSGKIRDRISRRDRVIGFEMEGAGVWDELPSCLVIKGVCDYADSHKQKGWQEYAAATAASTAKALLRKHLKAWRSTRETQDGTSPPCYYVQLAKNPRFTGRLSILNKLEEKLFGNDSSQKVALVGLGGVGKTQIALRFAYEMKERRPEYSIFWLPLFSEESAEKAFVDIAKKLGLQRKRDDDDVKSLVCQHLNSDRAGKWLFVIDNADSQSLISGSMEKPGFGDFFPASENGILLMTTRSGHVAGEFAGPDVIEIEQMDQTEAADLFWKHLIRKERQEYDVLVAKLLEYLTFLPLAITQAASYLNQTKAPIETYFRLLQQAERDLPTVLGRNFKDTTRYRGFRNAVGKTWLVSFQQIEQSDKVAVKLLSFLSCIEPKAIPQALLPDAGSERMEWAVGVLCAYSFLVRRGETNMLDMHSLVHMATRQWVEEQGWRDQAVHDATSHVVKVFPPNTRANRELWRECLPHATRLLELNTEKTLADTHLLYQQIGDCLYTDRRFKEAVSCYEPVCRWTRVQLPYDDSSRLRSEQALARAYLDDRRIKDAIDIFEHVVAVQEETVNEKDQSRLWSEHELARAYLDDRRIKDAIDIFEHVVAVRKETLDEKDYSRLWSEHELARAYLDDRRISEAIEILEHVVAIRKETVNEKDQSRLWSEHELARAYLDDRRIKDAIEIFEHVVAVQEETLDEKDQNRLTSEHQLASAYLDDRRISDAIEILEHVVAIRKETLAETHPSRLASQYQLASAYQANDQAKEAISSSTGRREAKRMHHGSLAFQQPSEPRTSDDPLLSFTAALQLGNKLALTNLLENDFRGIAQGDYAWLVELEELGYTRSEVAAVLLEDASDSPWIFFDPAPQHDPTLVVEFQKHLPGCVHQISWPSRDSDENPQRSANCYVTRQSSAIWQIQTLCGLAGVTPSTRELEDWNGVVVFDDNTVASVTYAHEDVSRVVSRIINILKLLLNALHYAQSAGLCCQSFTILRQETGWPDTAVVDLSRIEFSEAKAILDEVENIATRENVMGAEVSATVAFLAGMFPGENFFDSEKGDFLNALHLCCLSAQVLTVGFLSYIQAHAGSLHPYFLDTPTTKLKLFGAHSLSDQPIIEVELRELTCMGDMLQSPVLVFYTAESYTKLRKHAFTVGEVKHDITARPEDVIDTWGPAQFIVPRNKNSTSYSNDNDDNDSSNDNDDNDSSNDNDDNDSSNDNDDNDSSNDNDDNDSSNDMQPSAIKICGGVIFMTKRAGNMFHWSKHVSPEEFCNGFLDPAVKIRIGSPITINTSCNFDVKRCRAHATSLGFLQPLGTYAPAWTLAEKQFGIQAGQYGVVQATAGFHRLPGRTLKQYHLEQGDEGLVPFLDECWAVQVSLCTGVARRVPLREMVADVLPVFANNLTFRDDYDSWVHLAKGEEAKGEQGITEAFRGGDLRRWLRTLSRPYHDLVLQMVRRILHVLSETGLDRKRKSLLVSWPYDDDTRQCFSFNLRQRESSWARLVADCEDSAVFVYASHYCLETVDFRCRGVETCPWHNVIPLLETTVMISSVATSATATTEELVGSDRLRHKETYYFRKLGDLLFVRAEQPNTNTVVKLVRKTSIIPDKFKRRLFSEAQLLRERDGSTGAGSVAWLMADL